jgi:hypothetical protein
MVWRTRLRQPVYRRTDLQMPHRNHRKPPRQPLFQANPAGLATRKDCTFPFFLRGRVRLCAGHSRARPSNTRQKPIISMYERVLRDDDWRDRQRRPTCDMPITASSSAFAFSGDTISPLARRLASSKRACRSRRYLCQSVTASSRHANQAPGPHCREAHLLCDIQPVRELRLA